MSGGFWLLNFLSDKQVAMLHVSAFGLLRTDKNKLQVPRGIRAVK